MQSKNYIDNNKFKSLHFFILDNQSGAISCIGFCQLCDKTDDAN